MWSFPSAKTLPKPDVDVVAGHTTLRVTVRQGDACDESAFVKHWRVTHCTQAASQDDARKHYYDEQVSDDSDDDNADDEYYYYDEVAKSANSPQTKCTNKLYTLSEGKSDFTIDGLSECTMYTVDLSPADATGHVLQPGEDYGSVHSTFCMNKDQFFFGDGDEKNPTTGEIRIELDHWLAHFKS